MPFIPHTKDDEEEMLKSIKVPSINALFAGIPESLRADNLETLADGLNEMQIHKLSNSLASKNAEHTCFIGAGSYEHHIPAAVWDIAARGEFLTAYTPYQAEASQGSLQLIYEYQTMIAELSGMEVANASLYDGATALSEALLMAMRINKESSAKTILIPQTLHPFYQKTINTILANHGIKIISLPFCLKTGITKTDELDKYTQQDISALVIVQPNFFGNLEDVDILTNWATTNNVISIACVNPISLSLLKPPGRWGSQGVDIACGEGQPLGIPMAYGGPYCGFLSSKMQYIRQMPGRLVGRTLDKSGQMSFTLTLQTREQHIRRAKATSNICTNQGLMVVASTIYMSLLGPQGMYNVASACHQNTTMLANKLSQIDGVDVVFTQHFFHEVLLQFTKPAELILTELDKNGIAGGYSIEHYYPCFRSTILVCATEMRTEAEIDKYVSIVQQIMKEE